MEVPGMDEVKKEESHMISAAAFVEGGIQEASDDACSICLEAFCNSDPSTVTICKHEFHFQCILEWCQRSSNCPMCWQPIALKDPASQELLEAVERERDLMLTPARNMTIFHHPILGDFELQHLPMGVNDPELEDQIIQHLAAAAAMGRTRPISQREGSRNRSSAHARPQFVVLSTNSDSSSTGTVTPISASLAPSGLESEQASATVLNSSALFATTNSGGVQHTPTSPQRNLVSASSGSLIMPTNRQGTSSNNRNHVIRSSSPKYDNAGPSELQSFSDNWKHRFNAMSMKYKESISKSTRGWKEKLFSRSSSMAEIGSEVRREMNAGIATVSRMMERLETRDGNRAAPAPPANNTVNSSNLGESNHERGSTATDITSNGSNSASVAANSISS